MKSTAGVLMLEVLWDPLQMGKALYKNWLLLLLILLLVLLLIAKMITEIFLQSVDVCFFPLHILVILWGIVASSMAVCVRSIALMDMYSKVRIKLLVNSTVQIPTGKETKHQAVTVSR